MKRRVLCKSLTAYSILFSRSPRKFVDKDVTKLTIPTAMAAGRIRLNTVPVIADPRELIQLEKTTFLKD